MTFSGAPLAEILLGNREMPSVLVWLLEICLKVIDNVAEVSVFASHACLRCEGCRMRLAIAFRGFSPSILSFRGRNLRPTSFCLLARDYVSAAETFYFRLNSAFS